MLLSIGQEPLSRYAGRVGCLIHWLKIVPKTIATPFFLRFLLKERLAIRGIIHATRMKRVASTNTTECQPSPSDRAVAADSFLTIGATTGMETALPTHEWAEKKTVELYQPQ
ncbi:hypothetical protein AL01_00105 [Bombella intestini]|uniref:Uncharacterized protein n=1 Tax=Bombella intestini TaxID=1539051 RepID=A0A1S8GQZ4_9PROT|nr:hypothetical protein AL01_00105 [Bombella intestini]